MPSFGKAPWREGENLRENPLMPKHSMRRMPSKLSFFIFTNNRKGFKLARCISLYVGAL